MELVARFGNPSMNEETELRFLEWASAVHSLRATGRIPQPVDASWIELQETIASWMQIR